MKRKIIDIIIPTYNASEFIERTLDSIPINDKINVIIVNDGSTDNTEKVISLYKEKSDLSISYIKQDNKGEAGARNTGISLSKAEYILFLDADDSIVIDNICSVIESLEKKHLAILMGGYKKQSKDYTYKIYSYKEEIKDINYLTRMFFIRKINPGIGNTFFKTDIIKSKCLLFEDFKYGADNEFARNYLIQSCGNDKVLIKKDLFFSYNYNPNSIMNREFDVKRIDAIKAVLHTKKQYQSLSIKSRTELDVFLLSEVRGVYFQALKANAPNNILDDISKYNPKIINIYYILSCGDFRQSLANIVFNLSPLLYKYIVRKVI